MAIRLVYVESEIKYSYPLVVVTEHPCKAFNIALGDLFAEFRVSQLDAELLPVITLLVSGFP
jgi:hypothetical protein